MTECWTIGFIGKGEVTEDNAFGLLDTWLPEDAEVQALVPQHTPRTHKGLRAVIQVLEDRLDGVPQIVCEEPGDMLTKLRKYAKDGEHSVLVVLGVEDNQALTLAEQALDAGIPVKDLCAALDDVEFAAEPEPEQPPAHRTRGRKRDAGTVQAEVEGPATIVDHDPPFDPATTERDLLVSLRNYIRSITKEELESVMHPGVHTKGTSVPVAEQKIRAYVTPEGEYRKATKRSRKKADEEVVELTEAEAQEAGIAD